MKSIITLLAVLTTAAHSQNVGIGIIAPKARLHVADSSVVFTGVSNLPPNAGNPPISGTGTRMMWYSNKAAFRAGRIAGTGWDEANTGQYSAAFGSATAKGTYSFAAGLSNANGSVSAAFGSSNTAEASASFVIGRLASTTGSPTDWVDTDDLFVIGNGYLDTTGYIAGIPTVEAVRANAFRVNKKGDARFFQNATVSKKLTVNAGLNVSGGTLFNDQVDVNGNFSVFSASKFYAKTEFSDTVNMGNESIMTNNGGSTPNLDLVPICIYEFEFGVQNGVIPNFYQSGTNLYGNLISTISNVSDANLSTANASIGGRLNFNTTIANRYKKIIAVPSVTYKGEGSSDDARIITVRSEIIYSEDNKPLNYYVIFRTDDQPLVSNLYVSGTVMFYGLK
jgi:hypothetical protein